MAIRLNPYINFRENTRQAMEFYNEVFGGNLTISTFAELNAAQDPSENNLIMHAQLEAPNDIVFMAADTPQRMQYQPGNNFSMSLSGDDEAALRGYWDRLTIGGSVTMPLEKAIWGDYFGMCTDKFGINWLVNITASVPAAAN